MSYRFLSLVRFPNWHKTHQTGGLGNLTRCKSRVEGIVGIHLLLVKIQNVESCADQMLQTSWSLSCASAGCLRPCGHLFAKASLIESCHGGEGGRARCFCSGRPFPPSPESQSQSHSKSISSLTSLSRCFPNWFLYTWSMLLRST